MSRVSKLHSQAMKFTNRAQRTRSEGDAAGAARLFELALDEARTEGGALGWLTSRFPLRG